MWRGYLLYISFFGVKKRDIGPKKARTRKSMEPREIPVTSRRRRQEARRRLNERSRALASLIVNAIGASINGRNIALAYSELRNVNNYAAVVQIVDRAVNERLETNVGTRGEVHLERLEEVLDQIDRIGDREETPEAMPRLKSLLMRQVRMLSENRAIPHVVFSDGIYSGHPERKAKVASIIITYLVNIQKIVKEGIQDGSIRQDVIPGTASVMFLGMILPAAILLNVSEGDFDMIAHAENAWPAFVRCISSKTE